MINKNLQKFLDTEWTRDWSLLENEHDSIIFTAGGLTDDPDDDFTREFEYEDETAKNSDYANAANIIVTRYFEI